MEQLYRLDGERFATYAQLAAMRQERDRTQKLAAKLQQLGIEPN